MRWDELTGNWSRLLDYGSAAALALTLVSQIQWVILLLVVRPTIIQNDFTLTCPVCSVSSLLIRYIKKNLEKDQMLIFYYVPMYTVNTQTHLLNMKKYSHVIGEVVFIEGVGLKAVRRCVKVVTSNATYEAFCLHRNQWWELKQVVHTVGTSIILKYFTSMSSLTCSCWSLSSPKASMIRPAACAHIKSVGTKSHDI